MSELLKKNMSWDMHLKNQKRKTSGNIFDDKEAEKLYSNIKKHYENLYDSGGNNLTDAKNLLINYLKLLTILTQKNVDKKLYLPKNPANLESVAKVTVQTAINGMRKRVMSILHHYDFDGSQMQEIRNNVSSRNIGKANNTFIQLSSSISDANSTENSTTGSIQSVNTVSEIDKAVGRPPTVNEATASDAVSFIEELSGNSYLGHGTDILVQLRNNVAPKSPYDAIALKHSIAYILATSDADIEKADSEAAREMLNVMGTQFIDTEESLSSPLKGAAGIGVVNWLKTKYAEVRADVGQVVGEAEADVGEFVAEAAEAVEGAGVVGDVMGLVGGGEELGAVAILLTSGAPALAGAASGIAALYGITETGLPIIKNAGTAFVEYIKEKYPVAKEFLEKHKLSEPLNVEKQLAWQSEHKDLTDHISTLKDSLDALFVTHNADQIYNEWDDLGAPKLEEIPQDAFKNINPSTDIGEETYQKSDNNNNNYNNYDEIKMDRFQKDVAVGSQIAKKMPTRKRSYVPLQPFDDITDYNKPTQRLEVNDSAANNVSVIQTAQSAQTINNTGMDEDVDDAVSEQSVNWATINDEISEVVTKNLSMIDDDDYILTDVPVEVIENAQEQLKEAIARAIGRGITASRLTLTIN